MPLAPQLRVESLLVNLRAVLFWQHKVDGSHSAITADTLALATGVVGSLTVPDQPMTQVRLKATQTLATGVDTTIEWAVPATIAPSALAGFSHPAMLAETTVGKGTTFTPSEPGTYLIVAQVRWANAGPAVGTRGFRLFLNDGVPTQLAADFRPGTAEILTQTLSRILVWPNADIGRAGFFFKAIQDSGGNLDLVTTSNNGWVQVVKLS